MAVTHLALDLGARHQGGHRVDDDDVDAAGAHQHVGDLERLLAGVGLADEQLVDVDPDGPRVHRVHRVFRIDEGRDAARLLCIGHGMQGDRGLTAGLRAVDLDHAAAREAADPERHIERDRTGRDDLDGRPDVVTETHDGTLAVLLLDLSHHCGNCLVAVGLRGSSHVTPVLSCRAASAPTGDQLSRSVLSRYRVRR